MASQQLGQGMLAAGIRAYDRITNLFYTGEMDGSFLLHVLSIMDLAVPLVHLPIEGSSSCETTVQVLTASLDARGRGEGNLNALIDGEPDNNLPPNWVPRISYVCL
jgi:hypothetical protein